MNVVALIYYKYFKTRYKQNTSVLYYQLLLHLGLTILYKNVHDLQN